MIEEDPDEIVNAMQSSVWGGGSLSFCVFENAQLTLCFCRFDG